ncbi:hypothetical protein D3C83_268300 [compost metagenome]
MLMIEPPSPSAMRLPTSDIRRNGPLKLSDTMRSNRLSGVSSDEGASGEEPALFTRMSILPNAL